ncbi:MAG: NAD(P)-dependent dehydrogenase (short-subunit alcohol dehydrogenase family) [Paracoccaceae bacterium]|jgi:NAD(P)-dependent dehydrogenase (short-subunit alcohol dehydrogenase family)
MKTAIITGAAGGLGRALTAALIARGLHVCALDLPGDALNAMAGRDISLHPCDLTDAGGVARTCSAIIAARPSIDVVVHSAGVTQIAPFADADPAAHRRLMEVNYFAPVAMARAFARPLRAARGAHLVLSSVAGFAPLIGRTSYAASKHALSGFFASLRAEEAPHGVQVTIVAPSFVATNPDAAEGGAGLARPGSARDGIDPMTPGAAAVEMLRALDKGRDFAPVGRVARISWLLHRVSPRLYARAMTRSMRKH